MGNGTMVSYGPSALDRGILHRNGQKPREYPLNRGSLVIDLFKPVSAIVDLLPNAGGHANEQVTALLLEELGVTCRTQEVLLTKFLRPMQRTTILLIEHNLNFVMRVCDLITVLDSGEKIAEGSPEEIQNNQKVIDAYIGIKRKVREK